MEGVLVVRRSILIQAPPERVWREFENEERMAGWWGSPKSGLAGTSQGQRLVEYEPRVGGHVEMEVLDEHGNPMRYGGPIVVFDPGRELTIENDWIPSQGWVHPTRITLRLTSALGGTLVELFHYGFEGVSDNAADEHAGYEGGWGMTQLNALRGLVEGAVVR